MIIACNNCHKKFSIDSNLIPDNGRLLQCSSCNHKWFFKKKIINEPITPSKIQAESTFDLLDNTPRFRTDIEDKPHENVIKIAEEKELIKESFSQPKKKKNYKILNLLFVSLISFVAFIIILDTFKSPISAIVPNIELILYNLYETLKDISLFFKDLF